MARSKKKPADDLVSAIQRVPMFSGLGTDALASLASVGKVQSHASGDVIFAEGSAGDSLYLVLSGEVRVRKTVDQNSGEVITIGTMHEGDVFGEMSLFERLPRAATVLAHGDTRTFCIERQAFDDLLVRESAEAPVILRNVIGLLSHRLRESREEMRVVYELSEVMGSMNSVVKLGEAVLDRLLQDIPEAGSGMLMAWPEYSDEATVVCARNLPCDTCNTYSLDRHHPLALELQRKGTALIVSDLHAEHALAWMVTHHHRSSLLLSPMLIDDHLIGFLALGAKTGQHFSSFDVQLMSIIANLVAISFTRALQVQEREALELKTRVFYGR